MLEALSQDQTTLAVVTAALGFFFGVLTSSVAEFIKRVIERDRLIALITSEIHRNWIHLNLSTMVPDEPLLGRQRLELKGVRNVKFTGVPEYEFEVYNLKFFESEGVKLALHLRSKARACFWETVSLMRDAEAVRLVIKQLPEDDPDRIQYQKVFKALLHKLDNNLQGLEKELQRRRSAVVKLFD